MGCSSAEPYMMSKCQECDTLCFVCVVTAGLVNWASGKKS